MTQTHPDLFSFTSIHLPLIDRFSHTEKTHALFNRLQKARIPFALEVAVPHFGRGAHTAIGIPAEQKDTLRTILTELYPKAFLEHEAGVSIFWYGSQVSKEYLIPKSRAHFTHEEFLATVKTFSTVGLAGEGIMFRLEITPELKKEPASATLTLTATAPTQFRAETITEDSLLHLPSFQKAKGKKQQTFVCNPDMFSAVAFI